VNGGETVLDRRGAQVMSAKLGICPRCFRSNIEALRGVLRRCKDCGKYFGQAKPAARRPG
jgi:hypothetical protein